MYSFTLQSLLSIRSSSCLYPGGLTNTPLKGVTYCVYCCEYQYAEQFGKRFGNHYQSAVKGKHEKSRDARSKSRRNRLQHFQRDLSGSVLKTRKQIFPQKSVLKKCVLVRLSMSFKMVVKKFLIWLSKSIFYVKNYLSGFFSFHFEISVKENIFCDGFF